jgi:tRNA pseudouridine55 synthase
MSAAHSAWISMDGLLVIDKPGGCTSHDVVQRVRKIAGTRRVGHGGTLDPEATGVLLVAVGQATRFFPFLAGAEKTYEGSIRFGYATDTYDASGRPTSEERGFDVPEEAVRAAMRSLEGRGFQIPPPYSAKKLRGKPAYELARAGRNVRLEPAPVNVRSFGLRTYHPPFVDFEVRCSAGTYVRSLAHDLGLRLGCGAHLHSLRRTSVGAFTAEQALSLEELARSAEKGRLPSCLIPLERILPEAPVVVIRPEALGRVLNGSALLPNDLAPESAAVLRGEQAGPIKVLEASGKLLALARPSPGGGELRPFLVLK